MTNIQLPHFIIKRNFQKSEQMNMLITAIVMILLKLVITKEEWHF